MGRAMGTTIGKRYATFRRVIVPGYPSNQQLGEPNERRSVVFSRVDKVERAFDGNASGAIKPHRK